MVVTTANPTCPDCSAPMRQDKRHCGTIACRVIAPHTHWRCEACKLGLVRLCESEGR